MFETFLVGIDAQDHAKHDRECAEELDDCDAPKTPTPKKARKLGAKSCGEACQRYASLV